MEKAKTCDIVALGELLIDFTPMGPSPSGMPVFEQNPGGAPANVLAAVARLGGSAAFVGMVGEDQFGRFLKETLDKRGISTQGLRFSGVYNTTLAFVHLDHEGNRSFSFYRIPGADYMLKPEDVDLELISQSHIFHFGSLSLTHEPARSATLLAAGEAKRLGKLVSYDPNWRQPLWQDDAAAKAGMEMGLPYADVLKISDDEIRFITGEQDIARAADLLYAKGTAIVLVTMGAAGCHFRCAAGSAKVPSFAVAVVDTTGAGDAFMGGFLTRLRRSGKGLREFGLAEMVEMVRFSNAVGALCATRKGAISAMPSPEEVEALLAAQPLQ